MKPFSFPSIGVDISDESFKFLRLEWRRGHREIAFFGDQNFKKGSIEAGEIVQASEVTNALKSALRPYRKTCPYVILSLPEEKGFLRLVKMQSVPHEEIRQALEFQLEDHIPFPPNELYFDFQVLPTGSKPTAEMSLVVTAYPKKIVDSYISAVEKAGFIPVVCELESQAVARAVVPPGMVEAVLVGDIGRTRTTYSIVYRSAVHFTSTINVGGRNIDSILMESLHISAEQASEVKIGRGIDLSSEDIIKSLSPALGILKDEAKRQIGFWEHRAQAGEPPITKVFLCGGDAHLKGLPEFLAAELGMPVERAHIWDNIFELNQYIPPMTAHKTLRYGTALGLALRGDDDLFTERY
ncbi:MAG: type IV pilus assembly protein PilM [Patescibacteria group bacterium]